MLQNLNAFPPVTAGKLNSNAEPSYFLSYLAVGEDTSFGAGHVSKLNIVQGKN